MPNITSPLTDNQIVIIGNGRTSQSRFVGDMTYVFDAVTQSRITKNSMVTKHPTANNEYITDHVYQQNDSVTFDIILTDHPVRDPEDSGFRGFADRIVSGTDISQTPVADGRARNAYNTLRQIKEDAVLITVVSGFQSFYNCILTSINVREDRDSYALLASLTFEQLRIVEVRNETAVVVSIAQPVSKGTGTRETADDPEFYLSFGGT